jgi:hypothetical protein
MNGWSEEVIASVSGIRGVGSEADNCSRFSLLLNGSVGGDVVVLQKDELF